MRMHDDTEGTMLLMNHIYIDIHHLLRFPNSYIFGNQRQTTWMILHIKIESFSDLWTDTYRKGSSKITPIWVRLCTKYKESLINFLKNKLLEKTLFWFFHSHYRYDSTDQLSSSHDFY